MPTPARKAKVVRVPDGDTLVVHADGEELLLRLAGIDTPEKSQPYGPEAKAALTEQVLHKTIQFTELQRDRYGRVVALVKLGRTLINEDLVAQGHAWVYQQYQVDPAWLQLEEKARRARRGLWALPKAQREPPWEWRKAKTARAAAAKEVQELRTRGGAWSWRTRLEIGGGLTLASVFAYAYRADLMEFMQALWQSL